MADAISRPRKQRTRQHVIADLSVHHVEGFILEEYHPAQRLGSDYGYDLMMWTFDEEGYVEPGQIYVQLKAQESCDTSGTAIPFDLDIRDYNLWVREDSRFFSSCLTRPEDVLTGSQSNKTSDRTTPANRRKVPRRSVFRCQRVKE